MRANFISQAALGKNNWWRYVLSILAPVVSIVLANILIRQVLPALKKALPANEFGKDLSTFSLVFLVFGLALTAFIYVASRLHQRSGWSFINTGKTFGLKLYLLGFIMWGALLLGSAALTDAATFTKF